jgi:hypothetical protein
MPGAPVRIRLGVRGIGEREMYAAPVLSSGRTITGRPDQRMGELHPPTYVERPGVCRYGGCSHVDAERLAARWSSKRSPIGSAAAASTSSCVSEGSRQRRRT